MKKLALMCCFAIGACTMSFAQGGGGRQRMSPEEQGKNLQTQLKLTDDQTAKVTAIFTAQAKSMDSVRTAANGDRQAMMQAMRPMRQATEKKIKEVLTADQAAEYDKMMAARRSRMGGGGGTPPPSNR